MDLISAEIQKTISDAGSVFTFKPAVLELLDAWVREHGARLNACFTGMSRELNASFCNINEENPPLWKICAYFGIPLRPYSIIEHTVQALSKSCEAAYPPQITTEQIRARERFRVTIRALHYQWQVHYKTALLIDANNRRLLAEYAWSHPAADRTLSGLLENIRWDELYSNRLWLNADFGRRGQIHAPLLGIRASPQVGSPVEMMTDTVATALTEAPEYSRASAEFVQSCAKEAVYRSFLSSMLIKFAVAAPARRELEKKAHYDLAAQIAPRKNRGESVLVLSCLRHATEMQVDFLRTKADEIVRAAIRLADGRIVYRQLASAVQAAEQKSFTEGELQITTAITAARDALQGYRPSFLWPPSRRSRLSAAETSLFASLERDLRRLEKTDAGNQKQQEFETQAAVSRLLYWKHCMITAKRIRDELVAVRALVDAFQQQIRTLDKHWVWAPRVYGILSAAISGALSRLKALSLTLSRRKELTGSERSETVYLSDRLDRVIFDFYVRRKTDGDVQFIDSLAQSALGVMSDVAPGAEHRALALLRANEVPLQTRLDTLAASPPRDDPIPPPADEKKGRAEETEQNRSRRTWVHEFVRLDRSHPRSEFDVFCKTDVIAPMAEIVRATEEWLVFFDEKVHHGMDLECAFFQKFMRQVIPAMQISIHSSSGAVLPPDSLLNAWKINRNGTSVSEWVRSYRKEFEPYGDYLYPSSEGGNESFGVSRNLVHQLASPDRDLQRVSEELQFLPGVSLLETAQERVHDAAVWIGNERNRLSGVDAKHPIVPFSSDEQALQAVASLSVVIGSLRSSPSLAETLRNQLVCNLSLAFSAKK